MLGFVETIVSNLAAQEDAEEILQPKIEIEECWWNVFTEEILPRLPANHLQTLKSVCRNWHQIISSPNFVRLHLKIHNQSRFRVLLQPKSGMMIEYKYKYNINSCAEETKLRIPHPPAIRKRRSRILGSSNGLLCLLLAQGTIAVYNPSTAKYFKAELSLHDFHIINCYWFGQHPSSGEYVLVLGNFNWVIGVYNFSRSPNLETIHSTFCCQFPSPVMYGSREKRGILLHGVLHWPVKRNCRDGGIGRYIIWAYHLGVNKHFEISPPFRDCDFRLGVVGGCLFAILKSGVFELWIMKEYGVEQSWTKYANIQGFDSYRMLSPLGFFPDGDLILDVDNLKLIKYNFDDNKSLLLLNNDNGSEAIVCADSLVSPTIFGGGDG